MPRIDIHQVMLAASEKDRERLVGREVMTIITQKIDRQERALDELECRMMTFFEAAVGMRNFAGPSGQAQVRRIYATLAWVRAACERDGYPAWLTALVIERVQRELLAGEFPLVEGSAAAAMTALTEVAAQADDDDDLDAVVAQAVAWLAPLPGRPNPLRKSGLSHGDVLFIIGLYGTVAVGVLLEFVLSHVSVR